MMMPQPSTTTTPRCITFTSNQAPHEVSFCPQSWTTSPPPSRFDTEKNAVLFPNNTDGDDKWYIALDSYSLTLRLDLATTPMPALDKEILETTHGIVCITMMDKGYADNIATNTNKYEAVYPNNVLAGSSAHIYDTILHEEAYRVPRETYKQFVEGSLAHKYTYMHLPTRSADDANNKTHHPIFYPIPPLTTDYDRKTVVINAYLKLPPPDGGSDVQRRVYIPLFNAQTGEAASIVNRSFIKLQVCNEAHLKTYGLGPQYCTDTNDMSVGGRYLLGTINTLTYGDNHQVYPLKVNFKNAAIRSSKEIRRDDLQLDIDKTWEIAVTRVTYNMSESNMIMIPHPTVAKQQGVYDLYAGEIMIGACMYYPIVSTDDMTSGVQGNAMGKALTKLYNLDTTAQSDWVVWSNDNFGRLYEMVNDLRKQLNNSATVDEWYATDITSPYDASYQGARCPVFRWNYTDLLLAKYPERFQIHDNRFGLFSLKEIVMLECIQSAAKTNAQQWAVNYKVTGWHYRWLIVGKYDWYKIENSLPTFTLLDHTNQGTEQSILKYCVKIQPKFGTVYVALGSRMSKMFGYTPVGKTRQIMEGTTIVARKSLNIIYSCVRESYITPCQITARSYTLAPLAPRPWTHDSSAPAPGNFTKTLLWSLPKLQAYRHDYQTYYYLPDTPAYTLSDAALDTINGDDIFVYTNVLPITNHIGNHLSPLLVQIPCPAHMFGENRMAVPYKDLAEKTRITVSKTWDIQNPQFSTLSPGVNLDDMLVSVSNSYGDRLHLGVLDIQLIIREKQPSDNE